MIESTTRTERHFSASASLAAIGVKVRQMDVFGPIRKSVQIAQKTVKHTPTDKLYDAFISVLAGAQGLVEINTRLRSDVALQRAFGRTSCAEQSVVQETLDHCTSENVRQMEQAMDSIYRQHSQGYQHDYTHDWQILDVDMSGMPCGPLPPKAILPSSAIGAAANWGACWRCAMRKWLSIGSLMARRN
jgi:hypothetical protein